MPNSKSMTRSRYVLLAANPASSRTHLISQMTPYHSKTSIPALVGIRRRYDLLFEMPSKFFHDGQDIRDLDIAR